MMHCLVIIRLSSAARNSAVRRNLVREQPALQALTRHDRLDGSLVPVPEPQLALGENGAGRYGVDPDALGTELAGRGCWSCRPLAALAAP